MTTVQRETMCWIVKEEPDWHFDTYEEAVLHLGLVGADARIARETTPCWLAKCPQCGQTFGGDEFDEAHYASKQEAELHSGEIDDHCDLESA